MTLSHTIIKDLFTGPKPLSEIQELAKASLPTVRQAVKVLSDSHWVRVEGQAESNGGRPAMLFGIDDSRYMVLGLQLQLPGIRLIGVDLKGCLLKECDFFPGEIPAPNVAVRAIADAIDHFQRAFPERAILGLGIASPGFIDAETGDIIAIGRVPTWVNFPICKHLEDATGLSNQIANDVDCMAIAELSHQSEPTKKNLVYVGFCEGIKASLFFEGEMFTGSLGNVGLISPDLLNLPGISAQNGIRRLMTTMGFVKVFRERVAELSFADQDQFKTILDHADQNEQFRWVLERAVEEKTICAPLVRDLIKIVSVALGNIIHLFQPDEIILGGLLTAMPAPFFIELEASVRALIPPLVNNNMLFKQGVVLSENNAAFGAVAHFLNNNLEAILAAQT